jgi:hypothetical protein
VTCYSACGDTVQLCGALRTRQTVKLPSSEPPGVVLDQTEGVLAAALTRMLRSVVPAQACRLHCGDFVGVGFKLSLRFEQKGKILFDSILLLIIAANPPAIAETNEGMVTAFSSGYTGPDLISIESGPASCNWAKHQLGVF